MRKWATIIATIALVATLAYFAWLALLSLGYPPPRY
jgi:hypothetical protein